VGQSVAIGAGPRELGGAPPLVDTPSIDPCELASRIYPFEEPCKFGFVLPIYNLRLYILQPHLIKELYSLPCGLLSRARLRSLVRALKTRGLHIYDARALGAHNVPISLIARGQMWHLVDAKIRMVCPTGGLALSTR
jgi:hypothetical protein